LKFLLDTNAVSEPLRRFPDAGYMRWLSERPSADLAVSVLTFGEVKRGAALLGTGRRRSEIEAWLSRAIQDLADRLLPVDATIAGVWADLSADLKNKGRPVDAVDQLIAATALAHRLVLVTRNTRISRLRGANSSAPGRPLRPDDGADVKRSGNML